MKNLILILILAFTGLNLYSKHQPIEPLHRVTAFSGLKMRLAPNMESRTIKIIPFAEKVLVEERDSTSQMVEWLEGSWVKVKYEGREGYVFDAFLTSLPIPFNDYELSAGDGDISYPLLSWIESNFEAVSKLDTVEYNNHIKIVQSFNNGMVSTVKGKCTRLTS